MKLSEAARYWAARELTRIERVGDSIQFRAPFACPDFTLRIESRTNRVPSLVVADRSRPLAEVNSPLKLTPGTWCHYDGKTTACLALPKGESRLEMRG
jgi:hypothetical protein